MNNDLTGISPDESSFPPKPEQKTLKPSLQRSIISLLLFVAAFYFFFNWKFTTILVLTVVVLIHEYGHYFAMRYFKYKDLTIFFLPFLGALTSGSKDNISQRQSVIISLAGPIPGIIIGIVLYYLSIEIDNQFLLKASKIFLVLNAFNLIPVMPLDGGRIIRSLFFANNEIISQIFAFISIGVIAYYAFSVESYVLMIFPYFMLMQTINQMTMRKVRKAIIEKGINLNKSYKELTDEEYWQIRDEIGSSVNGFQKMITPGVRDYSPREQTIMNRIALVISKRPERDLGKPGIFMFLVILIVSFAVPMWIIFLR